MRSKHYIITLFLIFLGLACTELAEAKPAEFKPDFFPMCEVTPMVFRMVKDGKTAFYGGSSRSGWVYGYRESLMKSEELSQIMLATFTDVLASENKLIIDVECK